MEFEQQINFIKNIKMSCDTEEMIWKEKLLSTADCFAYTKGT